MPTSQERRKAAAKATGEILQRLEQLRETRGVSKRELDDLLGRGRGYHSHLFSGRVAFQVDHLLAILEVLGTSLGDFFASAERASSSPDDVVGAFLAALEDSERSHALEDFVDKRIKTFMTERFLGGGEGR